MRTNKLLIIFLFISGLAIGQVTDTTRIEIRMNPGETRPKVIPMNSMGFALLDQRKENLLDPSNILKLTGYDTAMQEAWKQEISYNKRLSLRLYEFQKSKLYLLFGNESREELQFYVIEPASGDLKKYDFSYLKGFNMDDFTVLNERIFLLGTLKRLPVLLEFDLDSGKVEPYPMAIDAKEVETLEVFESGASQVSTTVAMEVNKRKQVLTKTFDVESMNSSEFIVSPSEDYDILNGKVTVLNSNDKLVVGTYGYRNRRESQGMYVGGYVKDREVIKKYHAFTDMNNFFGFLTDKEQQRIANKASRKASKGKDLKLKYRLLVHEAIVYNGNYVVVGEAYYPTYRTEQYRRYGPRGYFYDTRVVFDGYRFTHAMIAAIDKRGEIAWDHSFKINDTKTYQLRERVKMAVEEGVIRLVYNLEGEVYQLRIKDGKVLDAEESIQLQTKRDEDKVRNSDLGEAEYWYGNYFLVWGFQRIKNNNDPLYANKRNVFYINKLGY